MPKCTALVSLLTSTWVFYLSISTCNSGRILLNNSTCKSEIFRVSDELSHTVIWDGRLLIERCLVRLSVPDKKDDFLIDAKKYNVKDCTFILSYIYGTYPSKVIQKYNCHKSPEKFRLTDEKYFYLLFDTSEKSQSRVEIRISCDEASESSLGTQLLAILFPTLAIALIYVCCKPRRSGKNMFKQIFCDRSSHSRSDQASRDTEQSSTRPVSQPIPTVVTETPERPAYIWVPPSQRYNERSSSSSRSQSTRTEEREQEMPVAILTPSTQLLPQETNPFDPPPAYLDCVQEEEPPPYPGKQ